MALAFSFPPKTLTGVQLAPPETSFRLKEGVLRGVDAVRFEFYALLVTSRLGGFRAEICTRLQGEAFW